MLADLPYRALISVGNMVEEYGALPDNVHIAPWFPQPSVIPQVYLVFHHGGNHHAVLLGRP